MNMANRFSAENVLMSVCGHLLLIAIMITSIAVVVDRAELVASDRIEIMEIDLNAVRVSGDESILYNVNADQEPEESTAEQEQKVEPVPLPEPEPEPVVEEQPIETPSLIEDKPVPVTETKESGADKKEAEQPKKKKTVVRVNREVVSLDRTLTISVIDALRVAMTRCWVIDTNRPGISDIRAVAHLTMRKNGTVRDLWFESAAREQTDPEFAYVLQTIRRAIDVCQPLKMLPPNEFEKWEKIQLTFYPSQGKVM